jgi:hypothetical protein
MKTGMLLSPTQAIPDCLRKAIQKNFPGKEFRDLTIRYYESVEDVGYEYFMETVLPACNNGPAVRYLAPFIAYIRLGEALVLDKEGVVVYETDEGNSCTETGPFWLVTLKSM